MKALFQIISKPLRREFYFALTVGCIASLLEMIYVLLTPTVLVKLLSSGSNINGNVNIAASGISDWLVSSLDNSSIIVLFVLLVCVSTVLRASSINLRCNWSKDVSSELLTGVFRKLSRLDYLWHESKSHSFKYTVLTTDIDNASIYSQQVFSLLSSIFIGSILSIALLIISPMVTIVILLSLSVGLVAYQFAYRSKALLSHHQFDKSLRRSNQAASTFLDSIKDTKLSVGRRSFYKKIVLEEGDKKYRIVGNINKKSQVPRYIFEGCFILLICLTSFAYTRWIGSGETLVPIVGAILLCLYKLIQPTQQIINAKSFMRLYSNSVNSLKAFLEIEDQISMENNVPIQHHALNDFNSDTGMNFKEFKRMDFINTSLDFYKAEGTKRLFNNISLSLDLSKSYVLRGPSGVGKSTLMNMIGCLDTPSSGSICLDNQNIHGNASILTKWHEIIAHVDQNPHIDPESLYTNLTSGNIKSDKNADLEKLDFILDVCKLSDSGLNLYTHLGDKGSLVSGGQAQRIALARALLVTQKY